MLTGVFLQADTNTNQNIIKGITLEAASKNNVKITQNAAGYTVTMQFLNTYNPFGEVTKSIKNGITRVFKSGKQRIKLPVFRLITTKRKNIPVKLQQMAV